MAAEHNVFITWSGDRSRWIAEVMYEWLPMVVQAAKPFFSTNSIDKGSRGLPELTKALAGTKVGIVCLTSENKSSPWVLYEAGALSKTIDDKTRLCIYLLGGLQFQDVEPPLGMFQATNADKNDTLRLIKTINRAVSEDPVPEKSLENLFELAWPKLEQKILTMPSPPVGIPASRDLNDVVAEILELARSEAERGNAIADELNYIEELIQSSRNPVVGTGMFPGAIRFPGFRLPSAATKVTLRNPGASTTIAAVLKDDEAKK
jgi:hypothetical protein